ncbi:MAG: ribosome recycling factor [Dehalococcoidia bacterium]
MIDKVLSQAEGKMKNALEALRRDLSTLRTGRASAALVEHLQVNYYDSPMPLNQLANISVPEARLIAIQPWDKQSLPQIEKAILQADLGLNPSNDGNIIRVPIPTLTEERRKELVKVVHQRTEEGRISLRNARRESLERVRSLEKDKELSEDERRRTEERLQKLIDGYNKQVNDLGQAKEKELMED